ncbi:conserved oligomeric Golgi complex subunit 3-like, partial [Vespula squamosa]
ILFGMFQFALLLVLTGFLLSLAIISRLMEVAITLIYPTSIFLVQQLVQLFVLITSLSARMTGYVGCKILSKICDVSNKETEVININLRAPPISYERLVYPHADHPYAKALELNLEDDEEVALKSEEPDEADEAAIKSEDEDISNSKEEDDTKDDA